MNVFKLLGNLGNIAKMQQEMQSVAQDIAKQEYAGQAGGGMVTVRVTGGQQLLSCTIDKGLLDDRDKDLIEDLVVAAVNDALGRARKESAAKLQEHLSDRFDMPDVAKLLGGIIPGL